MGRKSKESALELMPSQFGDKDKDERRMCNSCVAVLPSY